MTSPVPESSNEAYDLDEAPPGEHASELPGEADAGPPEEAQREENAGTALDQPSIDSP